MIGKVNTYTYDCLTLIFFFNYYCERKTHFDQNCFLVGWNVCPTFSAIFRGPLGRKTLVRTNILSSFAFIKFWYKPRPSKLARLHYHYRVNIPRSMIRAALFKVHLWGSRATTLQRLVSLRTPAVCPMSITFSL